MNLTTFVDVAIGLTVMYLGASLFVTIINEYVAQTFELRASQLGKDLRRLIDDPALVASLVNNPALAPYFRDRGTRCKRATEFLKRMVLLGGARPASFVDPQVLAQQLIGGLATGNQMLANGSDILDALAALPAGSQLRAQLEALARTADANMDAFVQRVAANLDRTLVAMSEVYKRNLQLISLAIGLGVAIALNLDTVAVSKHLYRDKEAREAAVAVALQVTEKTKAQAFEKCLGMKEEERKQAAECTQIAGLVDAVLHRNATLGMLPVGWNCVAEASGALTSFFERFRASGVCESKGSSPPPAVRPGEETGRYALERWMGLLLTALAISLGASFWFDLLNRLVNMRHGMRKPGAGT